MSTASIDVPDVVGDGPPTAREGTGKRLLRQPMAVAALIFIVLLGLAALLAPVIAPHDPNATDVLARLEGPSAGHLLGTDDVGRDIASRVLYGARVALSVSLQAVGLAALVGIPLGLVVAFRGGWLERVIMRLADMQQAIPVLLLAFTFAGIFGRGIFSAMLAVSLSFALQYVRITRASVLAEREKPYVDAAVVQGYPLGRLLFRHVLPNAVPPLVIQTSIIIGAAILMEATLSFLGLGVDTQTPSWGGMLEEARRFQTGQPLLSLVPGLALTLTVYAFNTLGDGVAEATGRERVRRRRVRRLAAAGRARTGIARRGPAPVAEAAPASSGEVLVSVTGLRVEVPQHDGSAVEVVKGVSFEIRRGEVFGLVGESGSGKSMTASALIGMVPQAARQTAGSVLFDGRELASLTQKEWSALRGSQIGMVFQDPMSALSPVHTVGQQITESLRVHEHLSKSAARQRATELLHRVGIPEPASRLDEYPHQFSGGMAQRAMIASALACRPQLLIADEPTTALDATVQRQVLVLLGELREQFDMTVLFISHDLAVISEVCDRIGVMRDGEIVEEGPTRELLTAPKHPYTRSLVTARAALSGPVVAPSRADRAATVGGRT